MGNILRITDVKEIASLSRSTIYREIQAGRFPKPVKIARQAVGWRASDIETWLAQRPAA